jgi:gluconolactonase
MACALHRKHVDMRRSTIFALIALLTACKNDQDTAPAPAATDPATDPAPTLPPTDSVAPAPDAEAPPPAPEACTGSPLEEGTQPKAIAEGRFLDGPQWIDQGDSGFLVYSEVDNQVIVRNNAGGGERHVIRETPPENLPIGNARSGDYIYTALSKTQVGGGGGAILRTKIDGTEPTTLLAGSANSPNDIVASKKGVVYFTDPGYQTDGISTGVFRIGLDGKVTVVTKFEGGQWMRADGIALSQDDTALFVGYFDAKQIAKYTLDADGVPSEPVNLPIGLADHPTGLAVDTAGNLWVAEDAEGDVLSGRVEVFGPDGKKWGEIPFADARPSGIAFGGADGKTVFITTERGNVQAGTLYTVTTRCAGVR